MLGMKVFSVTKAKDREVLGERVTEWLRATAVEVVDKQVLLTSDREYHCMSIVLTYAVAAFEPLARCRRQASVDT